MNHVLRMVREGVCLAVDGSRIPLEADTVCLHGDQPEAVAFAQRLYAEFTAQKIRIETM